MTTLQPTATPQQSNRFSRSMTVLVMLLGGALAMIGSTQIWVTATGFEAAHIHSVQLSGQEASPVITAMALVVIAAAAALSIARRVGRLIIGIVALFGAILMGWATINVIMHPLTAAAQKIAETTGTTSVADIAANIEVSVLPWLTILGSAVVVIGALLTLSVGARWPVGKTKKYDVGNQKPANDGGSLDEIDTWDELSRGEDPT